MDKVLIFGLCFSLFFTHSAQAQEQPEPTESAELTQPSGESPAPMPPQPSLHWPGSGRAAALAGGVLTFWGAGMFGFGLGGVSQLGNCDRSSQSSCESAGIIGALMLLTGLGSALPLLGSGIPALAVGVHQNRIYNRELRTALKDPYRRDAARAEILDNMASERSGAIAAGVLFGIAAGMTAGGGIELGMLSHRQSNPDLWGGMTALTVAGAVLSAATFFPMLWCAGSYSNYKSMLTGASAGSDFIISRVSLNPILSGNMYGLSLTGRFL